MPDHAHCPAGYQAVLRRPTPPALRLAAAAALGLAALAAAPVRAAGVVPQEGVTPVLGASAPVAAAGDPGTECERAVGDSLRELHGREVTALDFGAAQQQAGDEGHVEVKGEGRYRRAEKAPAIAFRYSCAFDRGTGRTSGVVLHEADARQAPALPVWQADLTRLSPQACESAVAERLVATHGRAGGIVFDGGSRKLGPAPEGRTALAGSGRYARAPGMAPETFRYRCEFDPSGRLASASADE